jgi:hypothetical protein
MEEPEEPEELEEPHAAQTHEPVPTATSAQISKIDDTATTEGMGILQKVLFLAVILGCIAVYLRMNKVKVQRDQASEKSLA